MAQQPDLRRIRVSDVKLAVRDHPGGEPALLALHGLGSNARWWDLVAGELAPAHRLIALDLRGHGGSDRPDSGYDFATVARDVYEVAQQLHPEPLFVAGHSWGASVALVFAATYPRLVRGVICVDGGATDLKAYFGPDWAIAERTMRPPDLRGITPKMLRRWAADSPLSAGSDGETAAAILRGNFEDDGKGTLRPRLHLEQHMQIARQLFELDGYAVMEQVQCPVLFIPAGSPDNEDAPKVRAMERARSVLGERAHVTWIDGVHDLPVQRPVQVAAAIADFMKKDAC